MLNLLLRKAKDPASFQQEADAMLADLDGDDGSDDDDEEEGGEAELVGGASLKTVAVSLLRAAHAAHLQRVGRPAVHDREALELLHSWMHEVSQLTTINHKRAINNLSHHSLHPKPLTPNP